MRARRRHPHRAVRIPRARRAAVSRKIKRLVAEGYSPRYAAKKAYHSAGPRGRRSAHPQRDCVGIHTHSDLGALARESAERDPRRLTAAARRRIPQRLYALPKRRSLPLVDAAHVRNAAARLEQMRRRGTVTAQEYAHALRRVRAAEARYGIHHRSRAARRG